MATGELRSFPLPIESHVRPAFLLIVSGVVAGHVVSQRPDSIRAWRIQLATKEFLHRPAPERGARRELVTHVLGDPSNGDPYRHQRILTFVPASSMRSAPERARRPDPCAIGRAGEALRARPVTGEDLEGLERGLHALFAEAEREVVARNARCGPASGME